MGKEPSRALPASRYLAVTLPIFPVCPMASNDSTWPLCSGNLQIRVSLSFSEPSCLLPTLEPALAYVSPELAELEDPPPHQPGIWNRSSTEPTPSPLRDLGTSLPVPTITWPRSHGWVSIRAAHECPRSSAPLTGCAKSLCLEIGSSPRVPSSCPSVMDSLQLEN